MQGSTKLIDDLSLLNLLKILFTTSSNDNCSATPVLYMRKPPSGRQQKYMRKPPSAPQQKNTPTRVFLFALADAVRILCSHIFVATSRLVEGDEGRPTRHSPVSHS